MLLADSAYPLMNWVVKPCNADTGNLTREERTFNYRLSRARMVTENAYWRLKGRWRIPLKRNDTRIHKLQNVVTACCVLHNLCETAGEDFDENLLVHVYQDGNANDQQLEHGQPANDEAEEIRNALKLYVNAHNL